MATSVGEIQLDLEVKSDLDKDVSDASNKIANKMRESLKSYSNDLFKELRQGLQTSLDKVTQTIENCLDKTKNELKAFVEEMNNIAKNSRLEIPVQYASEQLPKANSQVSQATRSTRGPPNREALSDTLASLNSQIEAHKTKIAEMKSAYTSLYGKYQQQVDITNNLKNKIESFNKLPIEYKAPKIDMFMELEDALQKSEKEATKLKTQLDKTFGSVSSSGAVESISKAENKLSQLEAQASKIQGSMSSLAPKSFLSSLWDKYGNSVKKGANIASKSILELSSRILGLNGRMQQATGRSNNLVRSFLIFSLLFPAISGAVRNLGTYLLSTAKTNEQFASSLNQIKSNLQTAFTPIFNAILPALNALMSALARLTAYFASFVLVLFGKSISQTRTATAGIISARDALNSTSASAKKASNAVKEATKSLMGFDAINKLDSNTSSDSGDTGGGSTYSPTIDINDSGVSDFAKKLRELWKNGDYSGIGKAIGEKINEAVDSFTDFISWDRIGGKITEFINGFCDLFNSLVDTINWTNIGKMFGKGINTLSNTLYLLLRGIYWSKLGQALANGFNGLVYEVDWTKLGDTLGSYFKARIDALYGFVSTVDWRAIGKALSDSLNSIVKSADWPKFARTLSTSFKGALNSLRSFLANFDWQQFGKTIADMLCNIDWLGLLLNVAIIVGQAIVGLASTINGFLDELVTNLIDGFKNGLLEFFNDPKAWIKQHIVDPFVQAIKDLFGIHSPSTVMRDIGRFLVEGLKQGIQNLIPNLLSSVSGWLGQLCKDAISKFTSLKNDTGNKWNDIKNTISSKASSIKSSVGSNFSNMVSNASGIICNLRSNTSSKFSQMVSDISSKAGSFRNSGSNLFYNLRSGMSGVNLSGTAWSLMNQVASQVNAFKNSAWSWGYDMMYGFSNGINYARNIVANAAYGIANRIRSILHFSRPDEGPLREYEKWMPDFMEGMANGIEKSKSKLLDNVKSVSNELASSFNALQQPEIAFAGSQDFNVNHVIQNDEQDSDLKEIVNELKKLKDYFDSLKETINDKDNDVYIDTDKIYKKFVDKHNSNARKKGKSDLTI